MIKAGFLTNFFVQLQEKYVNYFVLGSFAELPFDTGGSDIDIVTDEEGICAIESIFFDLVKSSEVTLASYYENYNTKFFRFLGHDWGVQIDVFYKGLCYLGCPYYPIKLLQPFVKTHNEIVKVLDQRKGFFVDYFKEVIHNGRVKDKYVEAVIESFAEDRETCYQEIRDVYNCRVAEMINSNLSASGLKDISKPLQKELQNAVLAGKKSRIFAFKWKNLIRLIKKRPGYVIVVEGTDGSGKSTIINHITPILNECFHDSVVYRHLRPHFIPDMGVLLGRKEEVKEGTVCAEPHSGKQSGLIGSLIRWLYYLVDYTIGYLKVVWPQIHAKSKVYVFDRYYYDYYIDQRRSRTNLPPWILRIGEWFLPKPDLIMCLGGDPKKIYERKPETSLAEVERQTLVLQDFCARRTNAVWIDTTLTLEETCAASMDAIYKIMSNRFESVFE